MEREKSNFSDEIFRYRLKKLRTKNHITQKELANLLDVDQTTIAKWEQGQQQPSIEKLNKLTKCLNIDINYLFGKDYQTIKIINYILDPNNIYDNQWLNKNEIHQITSLLNEQNTLKETFKNNENLITLKEIIKNDNKINNIILNNELIKQNIVNIDYQEKNYDTNNLTYINNQVCSQIQKNVINQILNLNDEETAKLDIYIYHIKRKTKNEEVMRMIANLPNENDLERIEGYCIGKDEQITEKANMYKKIFNLRGTNEN